MESEFRFDVTRSSGGHGVTEEQLITISVQLDVK